jgi:hypothetical protein
MLFIAPKLEAGNKPTDWSPAPEDVNDSIDNISVGSRNIARLGCIIPYDTGTTVSNDNFINSGSCIFSRKALNNSGPIIDHNVIWEQDQSYVISFLMRKLEGTVNNIYFWNDSLKHNDSKIYIDGVYKATLSQQFDINDDTAWHKYEIYFKAKAVTADEASSTGTSKHIIMQPIKQATTAYKMEIKNYKIEKGNKPTDWTPAPEDISDTINNIQIGGTNLIEGTKNQDTSKGNLRNDVTETNEYYMGCRVFKSSNAWADIGTNLQRLINKRYYKIWRYFNIFYIC